MDNNNMQSSPRNATAVTTNIGWKIEKKEGYCSLYKFFFIVIRQTFDMDDVGFLLRYFLR
jgi:hypothetical protein